jgi:hypothetical protein
MEPHTNNNKQYDLPNGHEIIRDSSISKIFIRKEEDSLDIDITFLLASWRSDIVKTLTVRFKQVSEYEFYWNDKIEFYTVSHYVFEKADDHYYISLDPYNDLNGRHEEDQDIVLCKDIEVFITAQA